MIRPKRIGHATFETTDLKGQIAYWTDVSGLVFAEREKNRAFLANKTGLLVVQLEQTDRAHCGRLSFEVTPVPISASSPKRWRRTASRASCATIPFPAWARC